MAPIIFIELKTGAKPCCALLLCIFVCTCSSSLYTVRCACLSIPIAALYLLFTVWSSKQTVTNELPKSNNKKLVPIWTWTHGGYWRLWWRDVRSKGHGNCGMISSFGLLQPFKVVFLTKLGLHKKKNPFSQSCNFKSICLLSWLDIKLHQLIQGWPNDIGLRLMCLLNPKVLGWIFFVNNFWGYLIPHA